MPKYAKLNAIKFGLAGGIVTAICTFLTVLAGILGIFPEYVSLAMNWLESIYGFIGVSGVNFMSLILATIYSGIDGFIFVWVFALIYNKILK